MKRFILFLAIAVLLCSCGAPAATPTVKNANATIEGPGFATAEEAVVTYLNCINEGDVTGAIATFAIETYVDKYDTLESVKNYLSAMPSNIQTIPVSGELSRGVLIEMRRNEIAEGIYSMYLNRLTTGTKYDALGKQQSIRFQREDEDKMSEYIEFMHTRDAEEFNGSITVNYTLNAKDEDENNFVYDLYQNSGIQRIYELRYPQLQGDEITPVAVSININGREHFQFMDCIRYGEKWYNLSPFTGVGAWFGVSPYSGGIMNIDDVMMYLH